MILKFKQEEELKGLTLIGEEEDGKKEQSTSEWLLFVEESKDPEVIPEMPDAEYTEDDEDNTE
jgi:hypothetical protein